MKRRFWPAIGLFFLAPLVAEYLLGNLPITALFALVGLAGLYGGGAVLIREFVRRRGWGYPSILVLALAYGVLEEGVTTQSLFNPNYADLRLLDSGHIGFLGMGAPWTLMVLTLHTVWSITVPIVLVEAVSKRPREPWLGKVGLAVMSVLFVLGVAATTLIQLKNDPFVASPAQFTGVALVFFALIGLAAKLGSDVSRRGPGGVPAVWLVGLISLAVTSAFMLVSDLDLPGWPTAAIYVVGWVVASLLVLFWSRREAWTRQHVLALASGALLTYAWHAFPESPVFDASKTVDLIGNAVFAALALVLLWFAWRRVAVVTPAAGTTAGAPTVDETIRRDEFSDS
ncbi:hypothetical protein EV138_4331 [Kribbella voronezhensis]|uniref:DUF998 domain-containing protein n=1 Tax=Kribbella voronezhensis TaxID=2512212 RepID=A0A4R7TGZ0_9ACTN|nr:hypothetical protein [Kribbella voronezhensis]TDU90737.1 hypothetical protein EV138_4331 [Kribbella voronezhensis]